QRPKAEAAGPAAESETARMVHSRTRAVNRDLQLRYRTKQLHCRRIPKPVLFCWIGSAINLQPHLLIFKQFK
ncbi:MAG: hypothetical protein WCL37_05335, partial [Chrysiogenales bacterium]